MANYVDMTGLKFTRLTVIQYIGNDKYGSALWECQCDCGNKKVILGRSLRQGNTKSCGCLSDETKRNNQSPKTHGQSKTRLHTIWKNMKERCNNSNSSNYKNYGARGVTICEEWLKFENFYKWAYDNGYEENLSLDRINVDGNYEPDNCRWATDIEQANNKRNNVKYLYHNKHYTVRGLSDISGLRTGTIFRRIKRGWSIEDAVEVPLLNCDLNDYKAKKMTVGA